MTDEAPTTNSIDIWGKIIGQVGFPIFVSCLLLYWGYSGQGFLIEQLKNRDAIIEGFKQSLNENTKATNNLAGAFDRITKECEDYEETQKRLRLRGR